MMPNIIRFFEAALIGLLSLCSESALRNMFSLEEGCRAIDGIGFRAERISLQ